MLIGCVCFYKGILISHVHFLIISKWPNTITKVIHQTKAHFITFPYRWFLFFNNISLPFNTHIHQLSHAVGEKVRSLASQLWSYGCVDFIFTVTLKQIPPKHFFKGGKRKKILCSKVRAIGWCGKSFRKLICCRVSLFWSFLCGRTLYWWGILFYTDEFDWFMNVASWGM